MNKYSLQDITNIDWDNVYKICFKIIKYRIQYRILQRIFGTNEYLYKIGKSKESLCCFCRTSAKTLTLFFGKCPHISDFLE